MDTLNVIIYMSIFLTVSVLGFVVYSTMQATRKQVALRADVIAARLKNLSPEAAQSAGIKRDTSTRYPLLDKLAQTLFPKPEILRLKLTASGKNISLGGYVGVSIILVLLIAATLFFVKILPAVPNVLIALTVGMALPHLWLSKTITKRLDQFIDKFPDAIDLMVRGLRSGLPVSETIEAVGNEMLAPVGTEFRQISLSTKLGTPLDDALWDAASRINTPEFRFFVICLSVQKETGGNLAETLANLSDILRQRRQMGLKIKAMSSEARASAMILGSLPFIMFALIYLINPGYESVLFTDPRGKLMLGVACGIMGMGVLVMNKMIKFEV